MKILTFCVLLISFLGLSGCTGHNSKNNSAGVTHATGLGAPGGTSTHAGSGGSGVVGPRMPSTPQSSSSAAASAALNSCYLAQREKFLPTSVSTSPDVAGAIKDLRINLKNYRPSWQTFTRSLGDSMANVPISLTHEGTFVYQDSILDIQDEFDSNYDSTGEDKNILVVGETLTVYEKSRMTAQYSWSTGLDVNCSPTLLSSSVSGLSYNADSSAQGTSNIKSLGQSDQAIDFVIPRQNILDSEIIPNLQLTSSAFKLLKTQFAAPGKPLSGFNFQTGILSLTTTQLSLIPNVSMNDAVTGQIQSFDGIQIEQTDNGVPFSSKIYMSGGYIMVIESIPSAQIVIYLDQVPSQVWMSQQLRFDQTFTGPTMSGFTADDFDSLSNLRYTVSGTGPAAPEIFNADQYMSVTQQNGDGSTWSYDLAASELVTSLGQPPVGLNVADVVDPEDEVFLKATYYIQPDKVSDLVAKVKLQLAGFPSQLAPADSRQALAMSIATVVSSAIQYDYSAVASGSVDDRTTTDILSTGKGVCQHFAVLFVAVARAMGLPSRIIHGYYLTDQSAEGHAWVEVKLNHTTWWPLEPQASGGEMLMKHYFPLGIMSSYESMNPSGDASVGTELSSELAWLKTKFTKD